MKRALLKNNGGYYAIFQHDIAGITADCEKL